MDANERDCFQRRELRDHRCLLRGLQREGLWLSRTGLLQTYQADFVCYGKIIIELKATSVLVDEHRAQLLNYLHATGFQLGLLVNFGHYPRLEYERIARTEQKKNNDDISF
jgi:GxxExxY protein